MKGYYTEYSSWDSKTLADAENAGLAAAITAQEKGSIFVATQWVAKSFMHDYGVNPSVIQVVRIGSNHMPKITEAEMNHLIANRIKNLSDVLNILFVGVDWERKGGHDFLELCKILKEKKICYYADIVGCTPEIPGELKENIDAHGFLSKADPVQKEELDSLYRNSHFFILPTHAECAGVVFCESSAYALPSLSYETGGLNSIIENGINGQLFPLREDRDIEDWVNWILNLRGNSEKYKQICLSSYKFANKELTWKSVG